jgi:hypothetical protein
METTINTKEQAQEYFSQMLKDSEGKAFIGMVHPIYGAIRGLNFILEDAKSEEIFNFIDKAHRPLSPEAQMKIIEKAKISTPVNIHELISKIWIETGMATTPQILPYELVEQTENEPETVSSLSEGIKSIGKVLKLTSNLQKKDPFFFRVGVI